MILEGSPTSPPRMRDSKTLPREPVPPVTRTRLSFKKSFGTSLLRPRIFSLPLVLFPLGALHRSSLPTLLVAIPRVGGSACCSDADRKRNLRRVRSRCRVHRPDSRFEADRTC